jgi:hypothetical protein
MEWHNFQLIRINTKILILQKFDFININKSKMADKNNNDSHILKSSATDNTDNCHNYQWRIILNTVFNGGMIPCNIYISI